MKKKKVFVIVLLIIVILLVIVLLNLRRESSISIQVTKVKRGEISSRVSAPGKIQPVTEVKISANIMGKITRLPVKEGDRVKKGQVLVEIDPAPYLAQVDQARASLRLSQANLAQSAQILKRKKELFSQGLASQEELEELETQYAVHQAQVARDEASLKQAEDQLAKTIIRSPIEGTVTQLNVELGEVVVTGTMNNPGSIIMTVADLSQMEVEAEVDENDIRDIAPNQEVEVKVDALPDTTLRGKVTEVGNAAFIKGFGTAEETTNFKVKVAILNPLPSLRPGMSSTVKITTAYHKDVLAIPIQAVVMRDIEKEKGRGKKGKLREEETMDKKEKEEEAVFVVESRRASLRPIKTGISGDTEIEILEGLKENEQVISGPFRTLRNLKDGTKIKISKTPLKGGKDAD